MANNVEFQDFSMNVKAALDDETIAWLYTWGNEIASQAQRNVSSNDWSNSERTQLRGSYSCNVDESKGEARIGSPMEQAFWEEFGTGEHADTSKNGGRPGRRGWWVYKEGYSGGGGETLTETEAKAIAADDPSVHATNGREPNYTLEKAFTSVKPKAQKDIEDKLKARLGK